MEKSITENSLVFHKNINDTRRTSIGPVTILHVFIKLKTILRSRIFRKKMFLTTKMILKNSSKKIA